MKFANCNKRILMLILTVCFVFLLSINIAIAEHDIKILWRVPTKPTVSINVARGGQFFGTIDKSGEVRLYNNKGSIVWKAALAGATNMLIAKNGRSVLVYAERDPKHQYVYFYNSSGKKLWRHKVKGSVWAGAVSHDGNYAAITTAKGYVYLYSPDPKKYRFLRWHIGGVGTSIDFSPDGSKLIIGTWKKSLLLSYSIKGKLLWKKQLGKESIYTVKTSSDGKTILTMLPASKNNHTIEIALWATDGSLLWRNYVKGFNAKSLVSSHSKFVALGYQRWVVPKKSIAERRLAVYNSKGSLSWEKGGLFFSPHLASLPSYGNDVVVTDGVKSICKINSKGKILSRISLRGTIRTLEASDDGSKILIYCGDGWLYLLKV